MKFLEYTPFIRINGFLNNVNLGDRRIAGLLEAYSCKLAGMDKKLSRSIEQEVLESLELSPGGISTSPVGPLCSLASRRTLIYLILTLSHMYPDYDFSMLQAHHFSKESGLSAVKQIMDYHLLEASKIWEMEFGADISLADSIFNAIDEVAGLNDCDIYSFLPDQEVDPFAERGSIWAFNYFFYNKKLKRVVLFSCRCFSKLAMDDSSIDDVTSDEDVDFLNGMDMED
ncbi:hypothetical protein O6H91_02G043300 [Diphasiastrum complanatum]|uniref:Uncharacterized protein n=4 Tax=Diphasiastrum complanatum TaxID=34168 RepID=A0ACC2EET8_DIPCM|nr:hypothetical protein O6H91_02G043300 [Diphasiastrum complanatum]KAJ7564988.1 hypothetical protein O6H91_02G043300 [Diphasiastrum complanatum]KAJ7564989.1 hypothetical protein O6H91_02G043300 [Diphasiastrum complanatum]KAJ7564990.1 hypothetical protein O6H91_02G043300 [Diphasiastrum complanatum]